MARVRCIVDSRSGKSSRSETNSFWWEAMKHIYFGDAEFKKILPADENIVKNFKREKI